MRRTIAVLSIAFGCFGAVAAPARAAEPLTLRDLTKVVRYSDLAFAPDGKRLVATRSEADLDKDEFATEIVLIDVVTGGERAFTRGRRHAGRPAFSPDGRTIAFLATDEKKNPQVYLQPTDGGDAVKLTDTKEGVDQFAFSPDGRTVAYATGESLAERTGEDKFLTAFEVKNDDFTLREAPRSSHVWVIPAAGGAARRLTSGAWSLPSSLPPGPPSSPLVFAPDGRSLFVVKQASPSTGDQPQARIARLDLASGALTDLTTDADFEGYPVVSPDGRTIAYWRNRDGKGWQFQDVWLAPAAGGAGRDISAKLDKNIYLTRWLPGGRTLLVGANDGTTVGLWTMTLDGAAKRLPLGDIVPVSGYWLEATTGPRGEIAFIGQTANSPGEIYLIDRAGAKPRALTATNAAFATRRLARSETFRWTGAQGRTLTGVLTYPLDWTAGRTWPLVLTIHGGPNAASKQRLSIPPQLMAAKGWFVFEPNYRGGDDQDNAFFASIYKDAGQGPGEDVMAGVEALKKAGLVDPARMAVSGWSYGGFMTTWLLSHYDVWKAGVAGAPVTDWVDDYNVSDGNVTAVYATGIGPYVEGGYEENRRQSPITYVSKVRAPTLILCDTGDFRVPITQSFAFFRGLKANNVETQFFAYPVAGHFPGDPVRQMDVWRRWIGWLEPRLK